MPIFALAIAQPFMIKDLKKEGKFSYFEIGEGKPIIILHGLMGGLSNFDTVTHHLSERGYQVILPELPIYTMPLLKTNVKNIATYVKDFIEHMNLEKAILLGNSLGGHIALLCAKLYPKY